MIHDVIRQPLFWVIAVPAYLAIGFAMLWPWKRWGMDELGIRAFGSDRQMAFWRSCVAAWLLWPIVWAAYAIVWTGNTLAELFTDLVFPKKKKD
jgi:hypothetical protein